MRQEKSKKKSEYNKRKKRKTKQNTPKKTKNQKTKNQRSNKLNLQYNPLTFVMLIKTVTYQYYNIIFL